MMYGGCEDGRAPTHTGTGSHYCVRALFKSSVAVVVISLLLATLAFFSAAEKQPVD